MFKENKNFYPTPEKLIDRMIDKIENWDKHLYILEPSSGKGDIIERYKQRIKNRRYRTDLNKFKFDAIELDFNLQSILKNKNIRLVHDDFLTFYPSRYYDIIIMNPPFDDGAEHLMKAIELQERIGGQIVCLLNAETIKNPYSNIRKTLQDKLTEYKADVEFLQNAFSQAERKTDVETALIYINVPMKERESLFESQYNRVEKVAFKESQNDLVPNMSIGEKLVFECDLIKKSGVKLFEEQKRISDLLKGFDLPNSLKITDERYGQSSINHNEFIDSINKSYWEKFITLTDIAKKLPSKLKEEFREMIDKQQDIDFTVFNIKMLTHELMQGLPKAFDKSVADMFDTLTQKYHYSDSQYSKTIHYYNGWASNNAFKVNNRVIIPTSYWDYGLPQTLIDLNLIFNQISGKSEDISEDMYLKEGIKNNEKDIETLHFRISSFKKGTIWIYFNNQDDLDKFNAVSARYKNWLPSSFGEKYYNDMTDDEKKSVDNFGVDVVKYNRDYVNKMNRKLIGG